MLSLIRMLAIPSAALAILSMNACGDAGGRPTTSATVPLTAPAASEGPLAQAPLPKEIITLAVAKECIDSHRFDEWQQLRRVFRLEGQALAAWETREKQWSAMKAETKDGGKARTWLLSGLSAGQQRYWAQWSFYRGLVRDLDAKGANAKLQQQIWDLAAPYADRQMARGYVQADPYLSGAKEEYGRYQTEAKAKLPDGK